MSRFPRLRFSLRTLIIAVLVVTAVAASIWHWARERPHIVLGLKGDTLLVDGKPAGQDWLNDWKAEVTSLGSAATSEAAASPTLRLPQERLFLQLDPDLSFGVLEGLLVTAAQAKFTNFAVRLGHSGSRIELRLPGGLETVTDGKYPVLRLAFKAAASGTFDSQSLNDFATAKKPRFLRIVADDDVAIAEVMSAVEAVQRISGEREVWFVPKWEEKVAPRGSHSIACSWELETVEIRRGTICEEVVVPEDILHKAEMGEERGSGQK
jgi:hypothetical protein